jgi:copper homeostasis protein
VAIIVEACVDSVESALAAERAGAARLELCDNLNDGGTTPSAGMIAACKAQVAIPVFVIIRPRGGDFVASRFELDVMLRDIAVARSLGADGIVIGLLTPDGDIDIEQTARLREEAGGLPVTFHRAFDGVRDRRAALDALIALGIDRVLTSGGARRAIDGVEEIAALVAQAGDWTGVMAGGGIRQSNAEEILQRTGVRELHVRPTRPTTAMRYRNDALRFRKPFLDDELAHDELDADHLAEIVRRAAPFA